MGGGRRRGLPVVCACPVAGMTTVKGGEEATPVLTHDTVRAIGDAVDDVVVTSQGGQFGLPAKCMIVRA